MDKQVQEYVDMYGITERSGRFYVKKDEDALRKHPASLRLLVGAPL